MFLSFSEPVSYYPYRMIRLVLLVLLATELTMVYAQMLTTLGSLTQIPADGLLLKEGW